MKELEQIKEAISKATKAPWKVRHTKTGEWLIESSSGLRIAEMWNIPYYNSRLIANAPEWISSLITTIESLQSKNKQYETTVMYQQEAFKDQGKEILQCRSELEFQKEEIEKLKPHPVICYPHCGGSSDADDYVGMHMSNEQCPACKNALIEKDRTIESLQKENEQLKKFCEEWVWGEDKFQEFGGWKRIEKIKTENEQLVLAIKRAHLSLTGAIQKIKFHMQFIT